MVENAKFLTYLYGCTRGRSSNKCHRSARGRFRCRQPPPGGVWWNLAVIPSRWTFVRFAFNLCNQGHQILEYNTTHPHQILAFIKAWFDPGPPRLVVTVLNHWATWDGWDPLQILGYLSIHCIWFIIRQDWKYCSNSCSMDEWSRIRVLTQAIRVRFLKKIYLVLDCNNSVTLAYTPKCCHLQRLKNCELLSTLNHTHICNSVFLCIHVVHGQNFIITQLFSSFFISLLDAGIKKFFLSSVRTNVIFKENVSFVFFEKKNLGTRT